MQLWDQTIKELFINGGPLMWPLLLCSVVALALMLDRTVAHLRVGLDYTGFVDKLRASVTAGQIQQAAAFCRSHRSPIAQTAAAYLENLSLSDATRTAAIEREGGESLEGVEKNQRGLSVVANISTLTGLLGTVAGLVDAFHQIELAGGQVQPSDLASGIWAALLTTVFGLVIAIPSFVAFHVFESKSDRIARRMSFIVSHLDQWLGRQTTGHAQPTAAPTPVASIREE